VKYCHHTLFVVICNYFKFQSFYQKPSDQTWHIATWMILDKLYHIMLYRVHLSWTGFELTTLVVIGTDCIGSYKANYYMIITTTTPHPLDVCKNSFHLKLNMVSSSNYTFRLVEISRASKKYWAIKKSWS